MKWAGRNMPSPPTSESVRSTMDFLLVSRELESGLCLSMSSQGLRAFFLDLGPGLYFGAELGEELLLLLASFAESYSYTEISFIVSCLL